MNVVDSSAWLSYFTGDNNANIFANPIEDIERLLVTSLTITEVFKCILCQRGEAMALEAIAHTEQGQVIPLNGHIAVNAAY